MPHDLTESDLQRFIGSETIYRHGLVRGVVYTEGVQHMAEHGGAYWLIDMIATQQIDPKIRAESFQVWSLRRHDHGNGADLVVDDGNGVVLHSEKIAATDFPLPEIKLYCVDHTIMLPSEY